MPKGLSELVVELKEKTFEKVVILEIDSFVHKHTNGESITREEVKKLLKK
jgi:hypothetical protein